MRKYYGIYRNKDGQGWAWRESEYPDDVVALSKMKTLALKKKTLVDGEEKERLLFYDLDYLVVDNRRVVFNG